MTVLILSIIVWSLAGSASSLVLLPWYRKANWQVLATNAFLATVASVLGGLIFSLALTGKISHSFSLATVAAAFFGFSVMLSSSLSQHELEHQKILKTGQYLRHLVAKGLRWPRVSFKLG